MSAGAWGVFLDRDGTLVRNAHHPVRPEQLVLYPAVCPALAALDAAGARLVIVSNQSAVARGLLDEGGLKRMDRRLRRLLATCGVVPAGTYYCPHHPEFTGTCDCRKPAPGLLRKGLETSGLKPERCTMVGDTLGDLRAGRAAGMRTVLVLTGHGRRDRAAALDLGLADRVCRDLGGAARWILDQRARAGY